MSTLSKSAKWSENEVLKICKSLKNGKARDLNGLIYEIFTPNYAGSDLLKSMTLLFNEIKDQLLIPDFMQNMTITSLFKRKGSRMDFSNQRGIFNISKVRVILDKLIHNDYYDQIDSSLSCSNVGG